MPMRNTKPKKQKKHHFLSVSQIPEERNLRARIRATLRACPRMPLRNILKKENPGTNSKMSATKA